MTMKRLKTTPGIRNILFATDLSEKAGHAFSYAAGMADAYGADTTILHVIEKLPPNAELFMLSVLSIDNRHELINKLKADAAAEIEEYIGRFYTGNARRIQECRSAAGTVLVEPGNAAKRILHHAGTGKYDALAIGSSGRGILHAVMSGGTSLKVIKNSPIPVFVVPMNKDTLL